MKPETRATVTRQLVRGELMYARTISVGKVSKVFANGWVEVAPQIQMVARNEDGVETPTDLPALSRIPVAHFKAGGFIITLPVKSGDEGIILFSDRGLSLWKETGRKAPPRESEFHGLNGAIFLPMPTSKPGYIKNYNPSELYVGAEDQSGFLKFGAGGQATLHASGGLLVDTPTVQFTGNAEIAGNLLVKLLTELVGAVVTGSTVTSAGIHTAPEFVRS